MAGIRVTSTSTVQGANLKGNSTHQTTELSPLDLNPLLRGPIQQGLVFQFHNPKRDKNSIIQLLKLSLSSTLDFFPPLAGRLAVVQHGNDDDDGNSITSFFIDCNNSGALFVRAIAENTTVADILQPTYVPNIVYSFFPLNGVRNYEGTTEPLLGVQVTEVEDGIFIVCTMNHSVVDGTSFWHFINSWSEMSGGSDGVSELPLLERRFPYGISRPLCIPFTKETEQPSQLREQRMFHFPKEKIGQLKAKANAEMGTETISSLQALISHIWSSVIRNQDLTHKKR